jgi:hypothetical protein
MPPKIKSEIYVTLLLRTGLLRASTLQSQLEELLDSTPQQNQKCKVKR